MLGLQDTALASSGLPGPRLTAHARWLDRTSDLALLAIDSRLVVIVEGLSKGLITDYVRSSMSST